MDKGACHPGRLPASFARAHGATALECCACTSKVCKASYPPSPPFAYYLPSHRCPACAPHSHLMAPTARPTQAVERPAPWAARARQLHVADMWKCGKPAAAPRQDTPERSVTLVFWVARAGDASAHDCSTAAKACGACTRRVSLAV
eukprot:365469-Chlamydomonas_euryale.AAC.21